MTKRWSQPPTSSVTVWQWGKDHVAPMTYDSFNCTPTIVAVNVAAIITFCCQPWLYCTQVNQASTGLVYDNNIP